MSLVQTSKKSLLEARMGPRSVNMESMEVVLLMDDKEEGLTAVGLVMPSDGAGDGLMSALLSWLGGGLAFLQKICKW